MLSKKQIKEEAVLLHQAEKKRLQLEATTVRYPEMQIEDSYAIQEEWMRIKKNEGQKVIGYKIGLTSKVMQAAMSIDEPDYGTLLDSMYFEHGCTIKASDFLDPRIEVELAFVLKKPLFGKYLTVEDVIAATDYVTPALEVIAARTYRVHPENGYTRTVRDTIADNAANAAIILGQEKVKPTTIDLRWVSALLYKNKCIEESGVAAAVLDHPAKGVVWLAQKYANHGIALEAGQIILSGSFTRPIKVSKGDRVTADYNELGKVECKFL